MSKCNINNVGNKPIFKTLRLANDNYLIDVMILYMILLLTIIIIIYNVITIIFSLFFQ